MSLWSQLIKTYDNIKKDSKVNDVCDVENFLLKDGLVAGNVDIEVVIDDNAKFIDARLIPKEDMLTLIPATVQSIGRTSGMAAHPLFDKLDYIVCNWSNYIDDEKFLSKHTQMYELYINNLRKWAEYTNINQIKILYKFFNENNVLDLFLNKIDF
ncbi:MAG: type I-C CRISPR-associated protein Cas8c/Csd1, partial [Christensenellales bacterium]